MFSIDVYVHVFFYYLHSFLIKIVLAQTFSTKKKKKTYLCPHYYFFMAKEKRRNDRKKM